MSSVMSGSGSPPEGWSMWSARHASHLITAVSEGDYTTAFHYLRRAMDEYSEEFPQQHAGAVIAQLYSMAAMAVDCPGFVEPGDPGDRTVGVKAEIVLDPTDGEGRHSVQVGTSTAERRAADAAAEVLTAALHGDVEAGSRVLFGAAADSAEFDADITGDDLPPFLATVLALMRLCGPLLRRHYEIDSGEAVEPIRITCDRCIAVYTTGEFVELESVLNMADGDGWTLARAPQLGAARRGVTLCPQCTPQSR